MSGRGKGVRRRKRKAIAGRKRTGERGCERRPTPVPGPEPEAAPAAAPPAKRKRADDNAANGEVVDFCDIFRTSNGLPSGHNVGKHEALACNANEILPKKSLSRIENIQRIHILP